MGPRLPLRPGRAGTGPVTVECSGAGARRPVPAGGQAGTKNRPARAVRGSAARRALQAALSPPSTCCSSPDSYISIMMSEPPMNSPFTYSCGMVGQLL